MIKEIIIMSVALGLSALMSIFIVCSTFFLIYHLRELGLIVVNKINQIGNKNGTQQ